MRFSLAKPGFAAVLILLMSDFPSSASLTTVIIRPLLAPVSIQVQTPSEEAAVLNSLRRDVAAHPADFIPFETESSAHRFIADHAPEAQQETEPQILARGILGYWSGKTLVVLPSLPTASRQ
jgi:hypothetical protein